jgi:hypothetical protein
MSDLTAMLKAQSTNGDTMSNATTLKNLLLGGAIVTPKSGVLIQNIHTVESKGLDVYVIGGEHIDYTFSLTNPTRKERWTTIELTDY